MPQFAIIDAPSNLGLKPTGVEGLPQALKTAGLHVGLNAEYAGLVIPPPFNPKRDPETGLLNAEGLKTYTQLLANAVTKVLTKGQIPVVVGGDCSNLIGCTLALRSLGAFGLVFIDGHADFYQPEAEPNGEAASMELAIITGREPDMLSNIGGLKPLVREEHVVHLGMRDAKQQREQGSQDIWETAINIFDLKLLRSLGIAAAARQAVEIMRDRQLEKFWIHLDADVLDDAIMPAVDYRLEGGLTWGELSTVLTVLMASGRAAGINIGIFNPSLDEDGLIARRFVTCLVAGLVA